MKKILNMDYFLSERAKKLSGLEKRDHYLIISVVYISLFFCTVYQLYAFKNNLIYLHYILGLNKVLDLIALYLLRKDVSTKLIANIMLTGIALLFGGVYVAGNGGASPGIVWFVVFPVLAVSTLGAKNGFFWSLGLSLCGWAITIYMYKNGIDLGIYTEQKSYTASLMNLLVSPMVVVAMTIYAEGTKRRALEIIDNKAKDLENLNRDNKQLLAILFHDLANPLLVINRGSIVKENKEYNDEDYKKMLKRVNQASNVMMEITKYVRDYMAVKEGKVVHTLEEVPLQFLVDRINLIFQDKFKEKGLSFEVNDNHLLSHKVIADSVSLSNNVIHNLISNAIKFSPIGGTIRLSFIKDGEENISISVEDRGEGIPGEILDNLFNINSNTTRTGTSGEKGTGFGMPILHQTVEKFGGNIHVDSAVGEGTTFWITLKIAA